jgi:predicted Zn-dependent protease
MHLDNCSADLANMLLKDGRQEEARDAFRHFLAARDKLLELNPKDAQSRNSLAWVLATRADPSLRNPGRAVELAKKAVELAPLQSVIWNTLGAANYRAGDYRGAVEALQKSAVLSQNNHFSADAFFLAMANWQLGNKERARNWYRAGLAWMDKYAAANEEFKRFRAEAAALLQLREQRPGSAAKAVRDDVQVWSEIIDALPDFPGAHSQRGESHAKVEQWKKAASDFAQAVKLGPGEAAYWYRHALVLLREHDIGGYRSVCAAGLAQFACTEKPDAANWIAWTCALAPGAVDDWKSPLRLAQQASRGDPKSESYHTTFGAVLYRAGRIEEAIQELEKTTKLFKAPGANAAQTSPAYPWFFLAMAHRRRGNPEQSRRCLTRATELADRENINQPSWNRKLTLELLRREASSAIGAAAKK